MNQRKRSETQKKCFIKKVQHKESATWKKWNMEKKKNAQE